MGELYRILARLKNVKAAIFWVFFGGEIAIVALRIPSAAKSPSSAQKSHRYVSEPHRNAANLGRIGAKRQRFAHELPDSAANPANSDTKRGQFACKCGVLSLISDAAAAPDYLPCHQTLIKLH